MRNIQKGAVMHGTNELDGISKAYREPVIDHLDLSVDGGVFALLGPNGAGKTTLVSILTTLVRPDQGRARLGRSEEHTSELQSRGHLVCRLLLEKKQNKHQTYSR